MDIAQTSTLNPAESEAQLSHKIPCHSAGIKRRRAEAATMDYATRQVAKVAGASPRVKSGLIANSSTDTPSKLTS